MASETIINQKKQEVSKLAEEMKDAKLILLTDYRGINVTDDTTLRKDIRNVGAKYSIIKNNITKRALAECGLEGLDDKLEGPTAVIISAGDYLEASKVIYKFSKDNEYYTIKGGIIDGKVMTAEEIITLAKLPSRETLLSMLAGALLGNISKIAVALEEVRKQKEVSSEKVEEVAKTEAPVEENQEEKAEVSSEEKTTEAKTEEKATDEAKQEVEQETKPEAKQEATETVAEEPAVATAEETKADEEKTESAE